MSPRTLGFLMLLFCSGMAGASYARFSAEPEQRTVSVADVAATQADVPATTVRMEGEPNTRAIQREPAVRVILPSPYEIRSN